MARAVIDYLPKGQSLPEEVWRVRHRTLTYLLRAHVVAIFFYGLARGKGAAHSAAEATIVASFAALATLTQNRKVSSGATALGLVASSAVLVHLSGGIIEMHFHFFVMVGILTLYQDWLPFLAAIGFVVLHHGVMGALRPQDVYNHPSAIAHPFRWALIHGGFVLAASAASVIAWRLNEEQALKDPLTALPNRRLFHDRVGHALVRTQRVPGSVAVLFVDLDGFKDVNDSLGHAAGDQLLIAVAERLRASLRPGDTPARLGGDEFAILVEDLKSEGDALQVADRLLESLTVPFVVRNKEIVIGASVGVALSRCGDTADDVLRNADVAMYTVKTGGRGRRELFETAMHAAVVERVQLEQDMHRALEANEFVVHYQPVISLATGRIAGLEALIRWQHPTKGLLPPLEFLPLAEQTGLIVPIGTWVLNHACRQARTWKDRFADRPFTMSVNLSPTQLVQPNLVDVVKAALRSSGLAPGDLVLELTEGVMVDDATVTVDRLHELKALGVQLAVDDFGTGYSSLSYLRRLPIDILKIDKMFIDSIADGPTEAEFARSIISLAHNLHLETVAEGVEEADQVTCLRDLGCNLAQGYRFARPLDVDGIAALFAAAEVSDGWHASKVSSQ
jgi:diguanylate cyclase (GGDEF)-like protein